MLAAGWDCQADFQSLHTMLASQAAGAALLMLAAEGSPWIADVLQQVLPVRALQRV